MAPHTLLVQTLVAQRCVTVQALADGASASAQRAQAHTATLMGWAVPLYSYSAGARREAIQRATEAAELCLL